MLPKRLILRLSSLGDVILATSALEADRENNYFDWLVSEEYREILHGHPKINRVLVFDRALGFRNWVFTCRQIWEYRYDEIIDLHCTLRTKIMKQLFLFWSKKEKIAPPLWRSVPKQ